MTERDIRRLDKRIQKASSVLRSCLDSLRVVERRMWAKLADILGNPNHPLYHTLMEQRRSHSRWLAVLRSRTERHRWSLVPSAIRLLNSSVVDRGR